MMFLSTEELAELTGYMRNADQRRWLTKHGWKHEVSATGRPIVSKSYAETMLSGETSNKKWTPNTAVFSKRAA